MKLSTFFKFAHPKYLWNHRSGHCAVCRRKTWFLLSLPPELIRNDALCMRCGSASRHRHMARCILDVFSDRGILDLADFGNRPELRVFNTVTIGPIVKRMGVHPNIVCSEYFDDVPPGGFKNGVLCQNLEKLSFADSSFDLILSEDVFEHLQEYRQGYREVFRVLRPGGYHVFSIPFYYQSKSVDLFERKDGKLVPIGPIEYHGDPVRGEIPTYTHFGFDVVTLLEGIGFEVDIRISRPADDMRYGTFDCLTFITRKAA